MGLYMYTFLYLQNCILYIMITYEFVNNNFLSFIFIFISSNERTRMQNSSVSIVSVLLY